MTKKHEGRHKCIKWRYEKVMGGGHLRATKRRYRPTERF